MADGELSFHQPKLRDIAARMTPEQLAAFADSAIEAASEQLDDTIRDDLQFILEDERLSLELRNRAQAALTRARN